MQFIKSFTLLTLLQASAMAVAVAPKCNADNCLRGLFGSNAKSSANVAACSTGLPTVTVSVDGTNRVTMTGTAALPAAATVCDGQGIDKRAARFQSACSCVSVFPSTVTQTATPTEMPTTSQAAMQTTSAAQTTTQAAPQPEVTIGQVADAATLNAAYCSPIYEWIQLPSASANAAGPSYTVPRAGSIVSGTTLDIALGAGYVSRMALEVWRRVDTSANSKYILVGKSDILTMLGTGSVVSFVLPQPIPVQAGDLLGLFSGDNGRATPCASLLDFDATDVATYGRREDGISAVNSQQPFAFPFNGYRLNIAAVLQ